MGNEILFEVFKEEEINGSIQITQYHRFWRRNS